MRYSTSEPSIDGRAITGARELRDPRSREYAIQTMFSLKGFLDSKTFSAKHAESELGEIKTYKHWEVLGFETLDAYLKAELGVNQRQLKSRLAKDLAADPDVPPMADNPGRPNKSAKNCAIGTISHGTNQASTLVRRLKRDHREIAEALARGEFPSARAAGIAAGIVKEPSALDKIRKLLPKLTRAERVELAPELRSTFEADRPVTEFLRDLRKELTRRRAEMHAKRNASRWNLDEIDKLRLLQLVDYIENELDRLSPESSALETLHGKRDRS